MVDFYHDLGIIIKHCSTVIVSAEWLIDLFKQLIIIPPFDETVRSEIRSLSIFKPLQQLSLLALFIYLFIWHPTVKLQQQKCKISSKRDVARRPKRNYKKPPRITGFLVTLLSNKLKKLWILKKGNFLVFVRQLGRRYAWPAPIETSYFIQGPYNLHYLLFSGIGALFCHHLYCFPSQSQTLFGIGVGGPRRYA